MDRMSEMFSGGEEKLYRVSRALQGKGGSSGNLQDRNSVQVLSMVGYATTYLHLWANS